MSDAAIGTTRERAEEMLPALRTEELLNAQKHALELLVRGAPLREVLGELARTVEALDGGDAVAAILLLDGNGCLWTGAGPGLPDEYNSAIDGLKARDDLGTCSVAAVTGRPVFTQDIGSDPNWQELKALPLGLGLVAAWSQPIFASDGRVLGTFGTYFRQRREPTTLERRLVEILSHTAAFAIERHADQAAMLKRQRLLDRALEAADMVAWHYDPVTQWCEFSPRAQSLYGLPRARFLHDEANVRALLHPEDAPRMWAALAKATDPAGDGRYGVEYRVRGPDGGWHWLSVWGVADFEGEGEARRAVGLTGASRDISDRKAFEHQQALLVDELSHRVKNNLAIVQAIANQTLRSTPQPDLFAQALMARISAIARAHNLLTRTLWRGIGLGELAAAILEPFGCTGDDGPISLDGPEVDLSANAAVTLSLVLHELATNAVKYGALSASAGDVRLSWEVISDQAARRTLQLNWREAGGPPVESTTRRGFGTRLLRASADQLGGQATIGFAPEGLSCVLAFPLVAA